jgi:hypothetical protein
MMELLLRRSYVWQNNESGFALEAAIATREETLRKIKRLEATAHSRERADLRRQILESGIKPGTPDDELTTARGRQVRREQAGRAPVGPQGDRKIDLLVGMLVVPTNNLIPNKENL